MSENTRECGDCQLCCKLLRIEELAKHPHETCKHQCAIGCAIHETRPKECQIYQCLWKSDADIPDEFRPDKLGCIIDIHDTTLGTAIICHQKHQQQWVEQPIVRIVMNLAKYHQCWIFAVCGTDYQAIFPEWASEQQKKFDIMEKAGASEGFHIANMVGKIIYPDE